MAEDRVSYSVLYCRNCRNCRILSFFSVFTSDQNQAAGHVHLLLQDVYWSNLFQNTTFMTTLETLAEGNERIPEKFFYLSLTHT